MFDKKTLSVYPQNGVKIPPNSTCYVACEGQVRGGSLGWFNSIDLSFDKPVPETRHMADSKSLVNDFFPRLQITTDKLMTHKTIVMVAVSCPKSVHTRFDILHTSLPLDGIMALAKWRDCELKKLNIGRRQLAAST